MSTVFLHLLQIFLICFLLALLYILLMASDPVSKKALQPFINHYIAHRGYYSKKRGIPENSIPAFERAVKNKYGIELDVQLSSDGVPVVFHDKNLLRVCGVDKDLQSCTFEELQTLRLNDTEYKIPTFEEVLKTIGGKTPVIVEIKPEGNWKGACEKASELLDNYQGIFCVESFNPLAVRWLYRHRKKWLRGQLSEDYSKDKEKPWILRFWLSHLLFNCISHPQFIAYEYSNPIAWPVKIFEFFYDAGRVVWTIRNEEELEYARKYFDVFIFEKFNPNKNSPMHPSR